MSLQPRGLSSFDSSSVKVASSNVEDPKKHQALKQESLSRYEKNKFSQDFKDIRLASLELEGGHDAGKDDRTDGALNVGLNNDNIWQL